MPAPVAGQIGANNFTDFEIGPVSDAPRIQVLKRPGVDYHAYKVLGLEYPEQELTTQQEFSSHSTAVAVAATYQLLVGNNALLYRGSTLYGTYKILEFLGISPPRYSPQMIGSTAGIASGWVVRARFKVQRQA